MYAHVTRLLKSVSDPFLLYIRTNSDYRKKPYPYPHPCIICSAPNPTKKSELGYGKDIIHTNPIRFHPYLKIPMLNAWWIGTRRLKAGRVCRLCSFVQPADSAPGSDGRTLSLAFATVFFFHNKLVNNNFSYTSKHNQTYLLVWLKLLLADLLWEENTIDW
jgi:hypothetical protein